MAQPRALAYHGSARGFSDGRDEDYSPPNDNSRAGRGDRKPRKRNSVACARCRKRKIKCTGDMHDGQGCEACQNSGTSPNNCFYLRVNSRELDDAALQRPPPESEWPYSVPTPSAYTPPMPRITSDPSQYALASANMLPPSTVAPFLGQNNGRTASYNELSGVQYSAVTPRQPISSNYHTSLDHQLPQYDMQASRHGYPMHMSQVPTALLSNPDHSHSWTTLSPSNRSLYHNQTFEGDVSPNYASSTYQYTGTTASSLPIATTEASPIFPGLSPLGTHLPSNGTNRTLPNPSNLHSSFEGSNGATQETDNDIGILQQHFDKTKDSWNLNRMTSGTSQDSVSSIAHDSIGASGPASSTASSSPDDTTPFAYLSLAHSSPVESGISTTDYRPAPISTTISSLGNSTASGPPSNVLVNSQLPAPDSSLNVYGNHTNVSGGGPITPQGVESNGLPAPHILQPQPRRSSSYDLLAGPFDSNQRSRKVLKSSAKS